MGVTWVTNKRRTIDLVRHPRTPLLRLDGRQGDTNGVTARVRSYWLHIATKMRGFPPGWWQHVQAGRWQVVQIEEITP